MIFGMAISTVDNTPGGGPCCPQRLVHRSAASHPARTVRSDAQPPLPLAVAQREQHVRGADLAARSTCPVAEQHHDAVQAVSLRSRRCHRPWLPDMSPAPNAALLPPGFGELRILTRGLTLWGGGDYRAACARGLTPPVHARCSGEKQVCPEFGEGGGPDQRPLGWSPVDN